ncbi:MAG TPA: hypothetical protein VHP37_04185 [Burkholderiales bacterium]|nr:hypothetical protein [Burkholderiales bacterium]
MMIIDAIRSAATQHAVYFLVTAYIESLRHFERSSGVPSDVLDLPLRDNADLERRARQLDQHSVVPLEAIVPVSELAAVLECAAERLVTLDSIALIPSARSDSRRSALSV